MTHAAKVAISIDDDLLKRLDHFVENKTFKNRSQAFQIAVSKILEYMEHTRLARECVKLDSASEQEMAEEGFDEDAKTWPNY